MIKFYKTKDPYGFLNNFYKANFYAYCRNWISVEHAYQAQKSEDPNEQLKIWKEPTSRGARNLGQLIPIRPDWDKVKTEVMFECVYAKFFRNPDLKQKLLDTGDEELVENSPIDYFWGCGADGTGQNQLGKILMKVRNKLREL